jgi:hypothetical protein
MLFFRYQEKDAARRIDIGDKMTVWSVHSNPAVDNVPNLNF